MGATSVTGTGPGESFGKPKPQNNAGCCPGCKEEEKLTKKVIKNGCYVTYKSSNSRSFKIGQTKSIKVC